MVKHSAIWERRWFQVIMGGRDLPDEWPAVKDELPDADLRVGEDDTVDHWVAYYREQIEQSRAVAAALDLDSPCARAGIIRETLDGSCGK